MGVLAKVQDMRYIFLLSFLAGLIQARRWLCDDMTRPRCPDNTLAVFNRPTGNNFKRSRYHPPPTCGGNGKLKCLDGSKPKPRFNTCARDEKVCNQNQGKCHRVCNENWPSTRICPDGNAPFNNCCTICDIPFQPCDDGSHPTCPCSPKCKCPWKTKNRNKHNGITNYNYGADRPGNRGHHWGAAYAGNRPRAG